MALRKAMWTILSSYNHDRTIFDRFHLPEGIEKTLVVNNILSELGELSIIYSRPDTLKAMIDVWSEKQLRVWTELWETMNYEYNPIDNYDRQEDWTDTETRDLKGTNNQVRDLATTNHEQRNLKNTNNEVRDLANTMTEVRDLSGSNNEVRNLKDVKKEDFDSHNNEKHTGDDVTQHDVWAFNDLEPHGATRDTTTYGHVIDTEGGGHDNYTIDYTGTDDFTTSDSGTIDYDGTDTGNITRNGTDTGSVDNDGTDTGTISNNSTDKGTITTVHKGRMHGNIGVTTTQKMIQEQRELVKFNIIDYIIEDFKKKFCLKIW